MVARENENSVVISPMKSRRKRSERQSSTEKNVMLFKSSNNLCKEDNISDELPLQIQYRRVIDETLVFEKSMDMGSKEENARVEDMSD